MSRARTLLVAGNDAFIDGVVAWVTQDARLEVVGRAHSGSEAMERIESLHPHLVLMDVTLPDISGFAVSRRIKSRAGAPLVVLLSFHDSRAARLEAWAAGADGFVAKSETTECLTPLVGDLLRERNLDVPDEGPVVATKPVKPTDVTQ